MWLYHARYRRLSLADSGMLVLRTPTDMICRYRALRHVTTRGSQPRLWMMWGGVGQCKEDLRRHYARNVEHVQPVSNHCIASNEGQRTTTKTRQRRACLNRDRTISPVNEVTSSQPGVVGMVQAVAPWSTALVVEDQARPAGGVFPDGV